MEKPDPTAVREGTPLGDFAQAAPAFETSPPSAPLSLSRSLTLPPSHSASPIRAWCYLIWLSWQRQARAHLMVWIALGLLAFMTFVIFLNTQFGRWNISYWRSPPRTGTSYAEYLAVIEKPGHLPLDPAAQAAQFAISASFRAVIFEASGLFVFSNWPVFKVF